MTTSSRLIRGGRGELLARLDAKLDGRGVRSEGRLQHYAKVAQKVAHWHVRFAGKTSSGLFAGSLELMNDNF